MKKSFLSAFAAACLCSAAMATLTPSAHAEDVSTLSDTKKLLVGEWEQDADRTVGEGDEAVLVSHGWERLNADGTSRTKLRVTLLSPGMPDELRVYDVAFEGEWHLEGDELHSSPQDVTVTPGGKNPAALNIAKAIKAEFLKPADPMILVSVDADNYVARATDGALISMTRK